MEYQTKEVFNSDVHLEKLSPPFFLIGLLNEFNNSFQAKVDGFFEDLSWKQYFLLGCIELFEEPPTINDISEVVGSSHQNVKQLLLKLEKKDFVDLVPDTSDRRKQRILTTPKAKQIRQKYNRPSQEAMNVIFGGIDEKKLETTIETMLHMAANLKNMGDII